MPPDQRAFIVWHIRKKGTTKRLIALAALALVSCSPTQDLVVARDIPVNQESRALAEVEYRRRVAVSAGEQSKFFAIDGDPDTWWSAGDFAPQWLDIYVDYPQPVGLVEFIVAQSAPGPATHIVRLKREENVVVWHRFDTELAADGHIFALKVDPPQYIDSVRVQPTRHEGWVALREVRIYSSPLIPETVSGLTLPVELTHAGDGSGRLFVMEQVGRVRIIRGGALVATPFLDISHQVLTDSLEQGLFDLAFPPSYVNNQHFYVSYTDLNGSTVISRFATSEDPDLADPDSEEIILTIGQPGHFHNGGTLAFGPRDGYLYISSGDGKATRGPEDMSQRAQDPSILLGKILRIDVESDKKPYAIPPDNPFVSAPGYTPEIWVMGLRNSWGFAFDQKTGDLFIPDAGHVVYEEVNFQPAGSPGGENYGWPLFEGLEPMDAKGPVEGLVPPATFYARGDGCAIVGGAVYREQFIYSDFCTGRIWSLRRQGPDKWQSKLLLTMGVPISNIGVDETGNVYALGYFDGRIYPLTIPPDTE